MITLHRNFSSQVFVVEPKRFPGGELHVNLPPTFLQSFSAVLRDGSVKVRITAQLNNSEEIMLLLLTTDALRQLDPAVQLSLEVPYLPYARQDRVAVPGESLAIKVMADLINSQNYTSVQVLDCHSQVGVALIDRIEAWPQSKVVMQYMHGHVDWTNTVLVAPDAGATKKTEELVKLVRETIGITVPMVQAYKVRDPATGRISDTRLDPVAPELFKLRWLVVDDICDGGRTFTELSKVIHATVPASVAPEFYLDLWVTHGIFSKGFTELFDYYSHIYTTNSFHPQAHDHVNHLGEINDRFTCISLY